MNYLENKKTLSGDLEIRTPNIKILLLRNVTLLKLIKYKNIIWTGNTVETVEGLVKYRKDELITIGRHIRRCNCQHPVERPDGVGGKHNGYTHPSLNVECGGEPMAAARGRVRRSTFMLHKSSQGPGYRIYTSAPGWNFQTCARNPCG